MNRFPLLNSGMKSSLISGKQEKKCYTGSFCLLVCEVRYYAVSAKECAQLGSPGFMEQRWTHTVNLSSSQARWLNSSRACWYFCFLSTREHHPFKSQAEVSQNLSNISFFSLVNSNKSIFPHVLVQGELSIKFLSLPALLLHCWTCAIIADPNTTSTPMFFPDSKAIQNKSVEAGWCSGKI